jgi:hypothetical protein
MQHNAFCQPCNWATSPTFYWLNEDSILQLGFLLQDLGRTSALHVNTYTTPSQFLRLTFGSNGQFTAWKKLYK